MFLPFELGNGFMFSPNFQQWEVSQIRELKSCVLKFIFQWVFPCILSAIESHEAVIPCIFRPLDYMIIFWRLSLAEFSCDSRARNTQNSGTCKSECRKFEEPILKPFWDKKNQMWTDTALFCSFLRKVGTNFHGIANQPYWGPKRVAP